MFVEDQPRVSESNIKDLLESRLWEPMLVRVGEQGEIAVVAGDWSQFENDGVIIGSRRDLLGFFEEAPTNSQIAEFVNVLIENARG